MPCAAALQKLQRRASYETRKGRCSTLNCCMFLFLNRIGFKETAVELKAQRANPGDRDALGGGAGPRTCRKGGEVPLGGGATTVAPDSASAEIGRNHGSPFIH
ncbi:hypothetical protein C6558_19350 [Ensifer sp. NM-2]|nr:hypothetical protein [Ensifer canadensis]PSS63037.1 hypothetical protein C6558_19350 [Ensifer sp. NM-2]